MIRKNPGGLSVSSWGRISGSGQLMNGKEPGRANVPYYPSRQASLRLRTIISTSNPAASHMREKEWVLEIFTKICCRVRYLR
jgi:hypothetical protein